MKKIIVMASVLLLAACGQTNNAKETSTTTETTTTTQVNKTGKSTFKMPDGSLRIVSYENNKIQTVELKNEIPLPDNVRLTTDEQRKVFKEFFEASVKSGTVFSDNPLAAFLVSTDGVSLTIEPKETSVEATFVLNYQTLDFKKFAELSGGNTEEAEFAELFKNAITIEQFESNIIKDGGVRQ